ncbi:MAG TPA: hypothetical protein VG937_35780 [Polyangiaceae bacterium]|nr:hypothetical protein [Polyangiaceae bacterium]
MLTRLLLRRFGGSRAPRAAALGALLAVGTLVSGSSSAAPRSARSHDTVNAALPNVTFTGFRLLNDGRALLYVELTSKVPVTVQKQKNVVTYELEGAQVLLKNNRNPLITSQFATILDSARLVVVPVPRKKGKKARGGEGALPRVQLVLRLREDVTPTHTFSERPSGAVLEITLPAAGTKAVSGSKG